MAPRRKHEHAAEIERLIEQLARWSGNAGGRSTSPLAWIGDFIRRRPSEFGPTIPLLRGEALDTLTAMQRMPNALRQALEVYYTVPGREKDQVRFINRRKTSKARISASTFRAHVALAHDSFWEQYMTLRETAARVGARNKATLPASSGEPKIAAPRVLPQSGPVVITRRAITKS